MECPKCHFDHPLQTTECLRCGVIFSKYLAHAAALAAAAPAMSVAAAVAAGSGSSISSAALPNAANYFDPSEEDEQQAFCRKAKNELICRIVALPAALLLGWLVASAMPLLAAMLKMWTHECGHALTGWLCGYPAVPTPWITFGAEDRMPLVSLLVAAGLAFGGYAAWRMERWFWVAVSVIVLALLLAGNLRTPFQAHCLITFGGDAGAFVISTILMATFYGRPESIVCRNQLRWVLVVIGAICFMQTYEMWAGGFERIVQWLDGIDERGPTDLAKLTQLYGWGIGEMQARFLKVAHACFLAMAAMYGAGIMQAVLRKREIESIVTLPSA